jgi:hypothetical protein
MTDAQRDALAEYLTGPVVAHASIALQVGGMQKVAGEKFFALRSAFGLSGYPTKEEALIALGAKPKRQKR